MRERGPPHGECRRRRRVLEPAGVDGGATGRDEEGQLLTTDHLPLTTYLLGSMAELQVEMRRGSCLLLTTDYLPAWAQSTFRATGRDEEGQLQLRHRVLLTTYHWLLTTDY